MWTDLSLAVQEIAEIFLHLSLKLNNSEEESKLSGVGIKQPFGNHFGITSVNSKAQKEVATCLNCASGALTSFATEAKAFHVYGLHTPLSLF